MLNYEGYRVLLITCNKIIQAIFGLNIFKFTTTLIHFLLTWILRAVISLLGEVTVWKVIYFLRSIIPTLLYIILIYSCDNWAMKTF